MSYCEGVDGGLSAIRRTPVTPGVDGRGSSGEVRELVNI